MGSSPGMLKAAGYDPVRDSDRNVYPPMSTQLERWDVEYIGPGPTEKISTVRTRTWSSSGTSSGW